jgi:FkbM family methyltransferase
VPLPAPARTLATAALRLPGRTIPVPGWFPLVVEPAHRRLGADPHPTVRVNGALMRLDLDEYVQRRIYYRCHEVPEARFVRRLLRAGDHVLDVGANVGFFTLTAAARVGPEGAVRAVEPIPGNAEVLARNVELNRFSCVEVTRAAAGAQNGEIRLGLDHPDPQETGVSGHYTEGGARDVLTVPLVALDDLLRDRPRLRLAKIDVEGAEPRVLAGMAETLASRPPDAMLMEVNRGALARLGFGVEDLLGPLRRAGYAFHAVSATGRLRPARPPRALDAPTAPPRRTAVGMVWEGIRGIGRVDSLIAVRQGAEDL